MEKEIKDTSVEIESEKTVEETTPEVIEWKAPESKDALDVLLKAEANRTYTKALKDLGVNSIKEFKELQSKINEDMTSLETLTKEKDEYADTIRGLEGKYNLLKQEQVLDRLNIQEEYREDLLKLAEDKIDENNPFDKVLTEMIEGKYKYAVAQSTKLKMGTEKTNKETETKDTYSKSTTQLYPWLKAK